MAPPSSSTARQAPSSRSTHQSGRGASRPPLRVVSERRVGPGRHRRLFTMVAASMVVFSLLAVVVGQALLANGQVRLTAVEQKLGAAQSLHRQEELQVAGLETPSRVISVALSTLHLVHPSGVEQLPYVSVTAPIPAPAITPPAATPTTLPATGQ
jgi:hypothetical protein